VPRIRTAKSVAKRIDLQYFTKLSPFRRWRLLLSIALPVVAAGWIIGESGFRSHHLYSSGPLSAAHAVFGDRCALCHVRATSYSATVADKNCLSCHDAPVHNQKQTFVPACSSCHVEHQGRPRLAETADSACSQCHSDLKELDGIVRFNPHISGFDRGHPQFAALRPGQTDPGTIRLNHNVHLQPRLGGPNGPVQMQCYDCHRPLNTNDPWPYSVAVIQPASQEPVMVGLADGQQRKRRSVEAGPGAYMTQIKYVNQCAACHTLQFDQLIPTPAPHAKPEIVHAFIIQKLTEYIAAHPEALKIEATDEQVEPANSLMQPPQETPQRNFLQPLRQAPIQPQRNIVRPTGPATRMAMNAQDWVQQRASTAERLLWEKNCKICHIVTQGGGNGLPTFVKAIIPVRWFPNAEFDHEAHRMVECTGCHLKIPQSKLTSDINIPGIEVCRDCHKQGGPKANAAEGRCFECHSYHDWRNERRIQGKFDISQVRGSGPVAPSMISQPESSQADSGK
jgi:Cytochrome c7 and related cytochrome c